GASGIHRLVRSFDVARTPGTASTAPVTITTVHPASTSCTRARGDLTARNTTATTRKPSVPAPGLARGSPAGSSNGTSTDSAVTTASTALSRITWPRVRQRPNRPGSAGSHVVAMAMPITVCASAASWAVAAVIDHQRCTSGPCRATVVDQVVRQCRYPAGPPLRWTRERPRESQSRGTNNDQSTTAGAARLGGDGGAARLPFSAGGRAAGRDE